MTMMAHVMITGYVKTKKKVTFSPIIFSQYMPKDRAKKYAAFEHCKLTRVGTLDEVPFAFEKLIKKKPSVYVGSIMMIEYSHRDAEGQLHDPRFIGLLLGHRPEDCVGSWE